MLICGAASKAKTLKIAKIAQIEYIDDPAIRWKQHKNSVFGLVKAYHLEMIQRQTISAEIVCLGSTYIC